MNHRIPTLFAAAVITLFGSSPAYAQQESATSAEKTDFRELQVKLAESRLQLAEMEWKLATEQNRRVPGLNPQVVLESLELSVAKAKAQVASAKSEDGNAREAMTACADVTLKIARNRLQRLKELAARTDVQKSEIERAQLRVTIAELERDSIAGLLDQPVEKQVQWQVDRIHSMIDGLSDRVIVLEDKR